MLQQLLELLNGLNLNIGSVYSDNNFAYHDGISPEILQTGKKNTQKIERKHLTFRTRLKRLARKTICFSKSLHMHKIMIGLLINVLEFGVCSFLGHGQKLRVATDFFKFYNLFNAFRISPQFRHSFNFWLCTKKACAQIQAH